MTGASAQTTSTWSGATGNWSNSADWSTPAFPNNAGSTTYNAVINSGAVTLDQNITVSGFTMSGGSVVAPTTGGPFTLTATSSVTWDSGTFGAGQTFQTSGSASISGQNGAVINGTLINSGTATSGTINGSGVINNLAGASYTLYGATLNGTGTLNNYGTLNIQTPGGTGFNPITYWNFNNAAGGLVTGSNTMLQFYGSGTQGGTYNMTSAALQFESGSTNIFSATSVVTGSINFYAFGGAVTVNGSFTPSGLTWVGNTTATFNSAFGGTGGLRIDSGGTVNLNLATTIAILNLNNGGLLTGAGALTLNGTTNAIWNGGTIAGTATAAIQNIGTLEIPGQNQVVLAHNFNNNNGAVVNWNGIGPFTFSPGITLTNSSGANFNAGGHVDMYGSNTQSDGVFDNFGVFTKLTDTGTINVYSTFNNHAGATVNVQTGTLNLANPGVLAGSFNVSAGATLAFSGTETLPGAASFTGTGTLAVSGGTATITGTLGVPNFTLSGGTLTGTGSISPSTSLTLAGGTLGLNLAVPTTSTNTFSGGTLTVGSGFALTIPSGAVLQATAGTISGSGSVVNQGTLSKTGTGTVTISAPFTNASGAQVSVAGGTLSLGGGTIAGTYTVSSGDTLNFSGTETLSGSAAFSGAGTVAVTGGTTTINGTLTYNNFTLSGGTFAGTGSLSGSNLTLSSGTLDLNLSTNGTTTNTFTGGTLTVGTGFSLTVPSGSTLQATAGTIAGPGSVINQGTLTKTGTGTVTITAPFTNASGAQVEVQGGTLSFGGGTLDGSYTLSAGATLKLAAGASVLATANITGAGRVTTAAAVTIAAGGTNNYSGGTVVNSGGNLLVTGTGAALGTGNVTVNSGGILRLSDPTNIGAAATVSVPSGAVLGLEASFDPTPLLAAASAGVLAIDVASFSTPLTMSALGNGQMFLGSVSAGAYTPATLTAGTGSTYRLGGGGGTLTLGGTNILTGATSVTVGATGLIGTVRITAANNYSVGTTLAAGTLAIGNSGALGSGPLAITGGILQADSSPISVGNAVTLNSTMTIGGTSLLTLAGNVTFMGNQTIAVTGTGGLSITGNVGGDILGRSLTVTGPGTLTLSGVNTFSGGTSILNGGTVQTAGFNQALGLGSVTVFSGGTLRQGTFSNLGGGSSVLVNSGGVLGLDGNFPPSLDPSSTGMVALDTTTYTQPLTQATMGNGQMFLGALGAGQYNATTLGAGTGSAYRLGGAGGTLTIPTQNVLTGFNSLLVGSTQTGGAGTVVLSASQNFQGNTTINADSKLVLETALTGPGTVFILPGATLSGNGATGGYVNLGGTISPGNSPGVLTFTNGVGFGAGSHYTWELSSLTTAGPGTAYDQVMVTGGTVTVDPASALDVTLIGTATSPTAGDPFWQSIETWPIVGLSGTATASGPMAFQINNSAWAAEGTFVTSLDPSGAAVDLVWLPSSVPEPGSLALVGAALALVAWRRRTPTKNR